MPFREHRNKLSLRDPSGILFLHDGDLIRYVRPEANSQVRLTLNSPTYQRFRSKDLLVKSDIIDHREYPRLSEKLLIPHGISPTESDLFIGHESIEFRSFPHEWCAEMLYEAASLTLDLAQNLLPEGLGLKDATPFNILFKNANPVFVDILSIEKRNPQDPSWVPYSQFIKTFLTPLLVSKYFSMPLDMVFLTHRDGLAPEEVYPMLRFFQKFTMPFFSLITVPTFLNARFTPKTTAQYKKAFDFAPEKARFICERLFKHLRTQLELVKPDSKRKSTWSNYIEELPYTKEQFAEKETIVRNFIEITQPKKVLDIGCNDGYFSFMAARKNASVVAIDSDPVVVGKTWREAKKQNLSVLPLVMDISRPSPAVGWLNNESTSFFDRFVGKFDTVFMLAFLHHLIARERTPLKEVIQMAAKLTTRYLIIEFVGAEDVSVPRLARGRDVSELEYPHYFESCLHPHFDIVEKKPITGSHRILYLLKRNS